MIASYNISCCAASLGAVFLLQPLILQASGLWVECAVGGSAFEIVSANRLADNAAVLSEATVHCKEPKTFNFK